MKIIMLAATVISLTVLETVMIGIEFVQNNKQGEQQKSPKGKVPPKIYLTEEQTGEIRELADRNLQATERVEDISEANRVILLIQVSVKVILIILILHSVGQFWKVIGEGKANNAIAARYADITVSANEDFKRLIKALREELKVSATAVAQTTAQSVQDVKQKLDELPTETARHTVGLIKGEGS